MAVDTKNAFKKYIKDVKERKMTQQLPTKDPQGLPQGDYMVILYTTKFASNENKSEHELLTLFLDKNNQWHVVTYLID